MGSSTSNSKNSKLYDYLEGFEHAGFTGSDPDSMSSSFQMMTDDIISTSFTDEVAGIVKDFFNKKISSKLNRFIKLFYEKMKKTSEEDIPQLADNCKSDHEFLRDLINVLCSLNDSVRGPINCYVVYNNGMAVQMDLCATCPYYLSKKKCALALLFERCIDDNEDSLLQESKLYHEFKVPCYKDLAHSILLLFNFIVENLTDSLDEVKSSKYLFQSILSYATIYTQMNPTGNHRKELLLQSTEVLESEPVDRTTAEYRYYDNLLTEVFNDVIEGKKKYVREFSRAYKRFKGVMNSPYNDDDRYLSLRGTGQSNFTREKISLISSLKEIDLYKNNPIVKEFDSLIGYQSPYPSFREYEKKYNVRLSCEVRRKIYCCRTIMINNPSKYKPRIIHIMDNPTQDRLTYIENRCKLILDSLTADCRIDQERGRRFAKLLTNLWYANSTVEGRIGVRCYDFSSATDYLDFGIQYRVIEFLMGDKVAKYWEFIQSAPSIVEMDGEQIKSYIAKRGNKQGEKGSFVVFSLCHHFVFLLLAKAMGKENMDFNDFVRIVGDDSVSTSFGEAEKRYYDPEFPDYDKEGIPRAKDEIKFFEICESFAGFKINYSKSVSTHYDSLECRAEFCKVSYVNGDFMSPWPVRLAMNYANNVNTQVAFAAWCMDRGLTTLAKPLMDKVLDRANDPVLTMMIKSGEIPYLSEFKDPGFLVEENVRSRIRFCLALSALQNSLVYLMMGDHDKIRNYTATDIAWYQRQLKKVSRTLKDYDLNEVPQGHKFETFVLENSVISDYISEIYEFCGTSDMTTALVTAPFIKDSDFVDVLADIARTLQILRLASVNPNYDLSELFPDFDIQFIGEVKSFSDKFLPRGMSQHSSSTTSVLQYCIQYYNQICSILDN